MCSVVEIKNDSEYYIYYRSPESLETVPSAKESLEYHPIKSGSETVLTQRAAAGELIQLGHSVFHKFGRLQEEWVCILPIVIHRILAQYQDIQNYKKGELGKLEHSIGETASAKR